MTDQTARPCRVEAVDRVTLRHSSSVTDLLRGTETRSFEAERQTVVGRKWSSPIGIGRERPLAALL